MPQPETDQIVASESVTALVELTPDIHPRDENPELQRIDRDIEAGKFPTEPDLKPILSTGKAAEEAMRDLARFAIISRLLFKNAKNSEILAALDEAGHPASVRTLQRTMQRSDFIEYYQQFRERMMAPVDKQIREHFKLAGPEAFNTLMSLMRRAKSEKVKYDAAVTILEGGENLKKIKENRDFKIPVPPDVVRALAEAGRRLETVPTYDVQVVEKKDEPADA